MWVGKKLKWSLEEIGQGEYVAQRFSLPVFDSGSLQWSFKICISNKFPGQGNAAGLGITLWEPIVWRKASMLGWLEEEELTEVTEKEPFRKGQSRSEFQEVKLNKATQNEEKYCFWQLSRSSDEIQTFYRVYDHLMMRHTIMSYPGPLILTLLLTNSMTWCNLLNLSELQFPHLKKEKSNNSNFLIAMGGFYELVYVKCQACTKF